MFSKPRKSNTSGEGCGRVIGRRRRGWTREARAQIPREAEAKASGAPDPDESGGFKSRDREAGIKPGPQRHSPDVTTIPKSTAPTTTRTAVNAEKFYGSAKAPRGPVGTFGTGCVVKCLDLLYRALIKSQLLYQLSYAPFPEGKPDLVARTGKTVLRLVLQAPVRGAFS